jgi:hypothetical protein
MRRYQGERDDEVLSMYEFTCQLATLEPPPPELQRVLAAVAANPAASDAFARMNAGATAPAEFFSPDGVSAILAGAHASSAPGATAT